MNQKIQVYISSLLVLVILTTAVPVSAQTVTSVRCPVQPKSQKGLNYVFFSFFKKTATVGTYIPANLVLVDSAYLKSGPRCLTQQTYAAFLAMNIALYADMQKTVVISSAWRSTQTQKYFAKARTDFAALPGRSEHQLGTTIDIDILGAKEEDYFGDSVVYQWMLLHAAEYGFVQSFNAEGEAVTGIPNEPWHWRFVGPTIATKVTTEKLDINAYLYLRATLKKKAML
jgi:LAS superfamily LD-carboxypeptidase LdcB